MKINQNLFKISVQAVKGRNAIARIITVCVIMIITLPMMLTGVSESMLKEVEQSKKDVYGEFSDILYLDSSNLNLSEISKSVEDELKEVKDYAFGIMCSVRTEKIDDTYINIGYADEHAIQLGRIKLIQGRFPKSKNEIAVTESIAEKLFGGSYLDKEIEIKNIQYKIVGIVKDYGRLWPRRDKEIKAGIGTINMFLSWESIQEIKLDSYSPVFQILLQINSDEVIELKNGTRIHNINNQLNSSELAFRLPKGFLIMLYMCELFVFYNVLLLSFEKMCNRYRKFMLVGMNRTEVFICLISELSILLFLGTIAGVIFGVTAMIIGVNVLNYLTSSKLTIPDIENVITCIRRFLLIACPCIILYVRKIVKSLNDVKLYVKSKPAKKYKKYTFSRLLFSEFKNQKSKSIFLMVLLTFCTSFITFSFVYKNHFSLEAEYKQYLGEMPLDYDIEFSTMVKNPDITMEKGIYFDDTYERDGASEEIILGLKNEKSINRISGYKENNKIKILLNENQIDTYLDATDFVEDGKYEPVGADEKVNFVFGYDNNILAKAKIVGYNEDEIESFAQYVIEGKVDIEKINSGEEIILVAPPFTLTTQKDGGIRKDWKEPGAEKAYENTILHAGDEITITYLESDRPYNGSIDQETLEKHYVRKDRKVKIGAVMGSYVGWFENEASMGESYYLYTTVEAFENLDIDVTYNRVRIFVKDEADYNETSEIIRSYSSELPYMHIQDLRKEIETYHKLKFMLNAFCIVLTIMVQMAVLFCVSSQILFKTRLNLRKYVLLRICGLSINKVNGIVVLQVMILAAAGVLSSFPLTFIMAKHFFDLSFEKIKEYCITLEVMAVLIMLIVFFVISIIPSIVLICRTRIKDVL